MEFFNTTYPWEVVADPTDAAAVRLLKTLEKNQPTRLANAVAIAASFILLIVGGLLTIYWWNKPVAYYETSEINRVEAVSCLAVMVFLAVVAYHFVRGCSKGSQRNQLRKFARQKRIVRLFDDQLLLFVQAMYEQQVSRRDWWDYSVTPEDYQLLLQITDLDTMPDDVMSGMQELVRRVGKYRATTENEG